MIFVHAYFCPTSELSHVRCRPDVSPSSRPNLLCTPGTGLIVWAPRLGQVDTYSIMFDVHNKLDQR